MQMRQLLCIGSLIVVGLLAAAGCQDGAHPTVPDPLEARSTQALPSALDDDTSGSEIVESPYKAYKIVAIGDSITAGVGASRGDGYPGWLESQLRTSGYENIVYNAGVPAATSEDLLNDIDADIRGMDIALIMIGTNDISASSACFDPYNPATCETLANIRFLIERTILANVRPVLGMVTPKRSTAYMAVYNPRIQALNSQLAAIAAEYQIPIVDTYSAILNNGGDALYYDKHHFTDQGYMVLANAFYQTLTTQVIYRKF